MKKKQIKDVVSDLKELFEIENNEIGSTESDGKFLINKQHFERFEVIGKLQNYFSDKSIDGGYLEVGSITFVFTSFEVKSGKPELVN